MKALQFIDASVQEVLHAIDGVMMLIENLDACFLDATLGMWYFASVHSQYNGKLEKRCKLDLLLFNQMLFPLTLLAPFVVEYF